MTLKVDQLMCKTEDNGIIGKCTQDEVCKSGDVVYVSVKSQGI